MDDLATKGWPLSAHLNCCPAEALVALTMPGESGHPAVLRLGHRRLEVVRAIQTDKQRTLWLRPHQAFAEVDDAPFIALHDALDDDPVLHAFVDRLLDGTARHARQLALPTIDLDQLSGAGLHCLPTLSVSRTGQGPTAQGDFRVFDFTLTATAPEVEALFTLMQALNRYLTTGAGHSSRSFYTAEREANRWTLEPVERMVAEVFGTTSVCRATCHLSVHCTQGPSTVAPN